MLIDVQVRNLCKTLRVVMCCDSQLLSGVVFVIITQKKMDKAPTLLAFMTQVSISSLGCEIDCNFFL